MSDFAFSRRHFLLGASALALTGCVSTGETKRPAAELAANKVKPVTPAMYYAVWDEGYQIPEVDVSKIPEKFWRAEVDYMTDEKPGTVVVDTPNKYLYHIKPGGRATRYGIGVGKDGYAWSGRAKIAYKRKWPRWTPPDEMVARNPALQPYSIANGGMGPGLNNPLGARAHYIHKDGRDTIYRIHGSPEYWTIGKSVSSGCIRMVNQDVMHLYDNVRDGSDIVVIPDLSKTGQAHSVMAGA
ncbi:L,D-transpeptidase [Pseudochrobactrum asaccharolyticum]|jgi:lipoprotein-anchoring transpeptidase ErfK/SrfK|uniref:Lipoprotein-anchoring transpeptidase ErfK/SrfK n=1 Tax=Pseudochrobactrum asaccharolyticum TaxID=354351 RepID=A0A366DTW6_9HYPH|nr:L,D-transpeptidase [Pseudochrobactrum asaccharolyticum]MBX8802953.1 L,D-transpeptidase [Ochrobactrum sp. MR28]MBX8817246.1 L,D-transpeptidase [Ochrobactrum sp. MR31]MDR2311026.1 L,D-transpeptidase [Brucellaceae bacterium]RBO93345.1 lipoprotein-anchoring transpeptidase ErfK/SrfK [Pseudochrobactrum asaccharolyticum]